MSTDNTLYYVVLVMAVLWGISWLVIARAMKMVQRSSNFFFLGNLLSGLGVYLLVHRTVQPSYLHYQWVEWLVLGAFAAWHEGILALVRLHKPLPAWLRLAPLLLAFCLTVTLAPDPSSFRPRAIIFSFMMAWLAGMCFLDTRRGLLGEHFPTLARWTISVPFGLTCISMLVRGGVTILAAPPVPSAVFTQVPDFTPFLWVLTVLLLAVNIALAGLTAGRLIMHISALADRDFLTGCLSRRAWQAQLGIEISRSRRQGAPLACVFFDLDNFKAINDRHGHDVGDQVLRHTVETVQAQLRPMDAIGRFGGEEFMVLMPSTALAGALEAATRMMLALRGTPLCLPDEPVALTASFGVVVLAADESQEQLLRRADAAMYAAKRLGRNRVELGVLDNAAPHSV